MTPYEYTCDNCGKTRIIHKSMNGKIPRNIQCQDCGCKMYRNWSDTIQIPDDFNPPNNKIRYDKSPSRRKHFW